jgi:hypothetical protein
MPEIATASLVLPPRSDGPPAGYACGAIGELVDGPAEVSLYAPPPLGVPLDISFFEDGEIEAHYDGEIVARARPVGEVDAHPPVRPDTSSVFLADATVPNRDGVVAPDTVWAALARASCAPQNLLARLAVERLDCVEVGEPSIALGWHVACTTPRPRC